MVDAAASPGRGRDEAFTRMVTAYQGAILRMCFLYLHDPALAEDALQETFLKAYKRMDAAGAVGVERSVVFDTARLALGEDPQYCTNIFPAYDVKQWFSDDAPKTSEYAPTMDRDEVVAKYGSSPTFWPLEMRYDQHRQHHMSYSLPRDGELTEAQALEIALDAVREHYGQKALDELGEYVYGATLERYMGEHGKEITFWVFMITNAPETFETGWQVKFIGENYEDYGSRCIEIYEPNDPNFGNG